MKTKFKLTVNDIVRGKPGNPSRCMLARCIRRTLKTKEVDYPSSDETRTGTCYFRGRTIFLPSRLNKAALRFDNIGGPVARRSRIKPFSFALNIPELD